VRNTRRRRLSPDEGQRGEDGERGQGGERNEHVLHAGEESGFHEMKGATRAPCRAVTQVTGRWVAVFRYARR